MSTRLLQPLLILICLLMAIPAYANFGHLATVKTWQSVEVRVNCYRDLVLTIVPL